MSNANVVEACKAAGIKDVWRWRVFIEAEREQGPEGEFSRSVRDEFLAVDRGEKLKKGGYLYMLIHGLPKHVASILLGTVAVLGLTALPAQRVEAAPSEGAPAVCILSKVARRWLRALQRLLQPPGNVTALSF